MLLPRRHTESLATAPLPDGDTAWPWTTAPRSGYSPSCTAAGAAPWLPHARWLAPRRRQMGLQVVKHHDVAGMQLRHQHHVHVRLERRRIGGARKSQRCQHPAQPQRCDHAHRPPRGTEPTARAPRGAQAGVGVMAVLRNLIIDLCSFSGKKPSAIPGRTQTLTRQRLTCALFRKEITILVHSKHKAMNLVTAITTMSCDRLKNDVRVIVLLSRAILSRCKPPILLGLQHE